MNVSIAAKRDEPPQELFLVDVAQWLARVMQYSSTHPSCARYGERTLASLERALATSSPLTFTILKDGILMGEVPATHRAVSTRLAPHLHARGVQVVRVGGGTTISDLTTFIETLTLPVQTTFDRGGIVKILVGAGVSRVQVDEIAHDIDPKEHAAQRRRKELRAFFAEALKALRAGRLLRGPGGEKLLELLDDPALAVLLLEEDPAAIAEAVAGLCLMVRQEEARSGRALFPKLKVVLLMLSPPSHARMLVGLPPLLGNFRSALVWAFDGLDEEDLVRIALPALRAHAAEVDIVFYAASVAARHDGRRLSVMRRLALRLHDLPRADATDDELLNALAQPVPELDSFRAERECFTEDAKRALLVRSAFTHEAPRGADDLPPLESRVIMGELVRIAASEGDRFERLCRRLPTTTARWATEGATDAILGVVEALHLAPATPEGKATATRAISEIATPALTARVLDRISEDARRVEEKDLPDLVAITRRFVAANPSAVWERLERAEDVTTQRVLLEALSSAGPTLLPLVRAKLRDSSWIIVKNAVALLPRVGGTPRDLVPIARHPNEKVRSEIMRALRSLQPDEASMDILVAYLGDAAQELRHAARSMLRAELLGLGAIVQLERIADDGDREEALRRRCIEVLGRSTHDSAAEALLRLIQPRSLLEGGTLRELAAVALRGSPAPRAAALFEQGLQSSVRRVRKACEKAAGKSS